jgi:hypothetical protein
VEPKSTIARLIHFGPGPRPKYGQPALLLLKEFWLSSDQMCSKRLKEAAPDWLPFFKGSLAARQEVAAMSPATMDGLLAPSRARLAAQTPLRDQARFLAQETYSDPHGQ